MRIKKLVATLLVTAMAFASVAVTPVSAATSTVDQLATTLEVPVNDLRTAFAAVKSLSAPDEAAIGTAVGGAIQAAIAAHSPALDTVLGTLSGKTVTKNYNVISISSTVAGQVNTAVAGLTATEKAKISAVLGLFEGGIDFGSDVSAVVTLLGTYNVTINDTTPSGSSSGGGGGAPLVTTPVTVAPEVPATDASDLIEASAHPSATEIKDIVEEVKAAANPVVDIAADDKGVSGDLIKALADTSATVEVETDGGNVLFAPDDLDKLVAAMPASGDKDVVVTMEVLEASAAPAGISDVVAVVKIEVKVGGVAVTDFGANGIVFQIAAKDICKNGEIPETMNVAVVNADGSTTVVSVAYNKTTGLFTCVAPHFSEFVFTKNHVAFTDVPSTYKYFAEITYLAAHGYVNGVGNDKFAPDSNIKRGDFIRLAMMAVGMDTTGAGNQFPDVDASKEYAPFVATAREKGIALGIDQDGQRIFKPEQPISTQEVIAIFDRILKANNITLPTKEGFSMTKFGDASDVAAYAVGPMTSFVNAGVYVGVDGKLNPATYINRGVTAQIMYNMITVNGYAIF